MFKVNIAQQEKLVRDRRIIERQGSGKVTVTCDAVCPRCSRERPVRMTIPNVVEARRILVAPS